MLGHAIIPALGQLRWDGPVSHHIKPVPGHRGHRQPIFFRCRWMREGGYRLHRPKGLRVGFAWFNIRTDGWRDNYWHSMTFTVNQRRAALDLSLFLAAFFILWTIRATWFYTVDESIASPTSRAAYADLLKLVLWVLPASAFAYWLRSTPPVKYLGLSVVPSLRDWLSCLAVTVIFLLAVTLFAVTIGRKSFSGASLSSLPTTLALLQLVISPLFEEILFRGLVMKELMTLLPAYLANVMTSLLFMGVHLPYWLSHGGLTQTVMANAVGVFLFSVVACWLFAKTASIWPPTLTHIANNLLSSMLVASRA